MKNITSSSKNNDSTELTDNLEKILDLNVEELKTWLGYGAHEECNHPVRASLRSASNLYYSKSFPQSIYPV